MSTADLLPAMAMYLVEPSGASGISLRPTGEVSGTIGRRFRSSRTSGIADNGVAIDDGAMMPAEQLVLGDDRMRYSPVTRIYAAVAFSFLGLAVLLSMLSMVPGLGALKVAVGITSLIAAFFGSQYNRLAKHDRPNPL